MKARGGGALLVKVEIRNFTMSVSLYFLWVKAVWAAVIFRSLNLWPVTLLYFFVRRYNSTLACGGGGVGRKNPCHAVELIYGVYERVRVAHKCLEMYFFI